MQNKRVAYFVSKWHVHQQVVDGAWMFAHAGYDVDLFLYNASTAWNSIRKHPNIFVHNLTFSKDSSLFSWTNVKLFSKEYLNVFGNKKLVIFGTGELAKKILELLPYEPDCFIDNNSSKWGTFFMDKKVYSPTEILNNLPSDIVILIASMYYQEISEQLKQMGFSEDLHFFNAVDIIEQYKFNEVIFLESLNIAKRNKYNALFGVEKFGLIWAGKVADVYDIPCIYHSLELYTSDHPRWKHETFKSFLKLEADYHRTACATIIQDEYRKNVLFSEHCIYEGNPLYVSISIIDDNQSLHKDYFWHERFNIALNKKIVLLLSIISSTRYCKELVNASQYLGDDFQVIIHGPVIDEGYLNDLKQLDVNNKVIISTEVFDSSYLQKIISSADIGLVFYHSTPINDRLTPFSSEKIARYLQAGLPIVTFDYCEYRLMLDTFQCGKYISSSFESFSEALEYLSGNYVYYSNNARKAFEQNYEFLNQYQKIIDFVEGL